MNVTLPPPEPIGWGATGLRTCRPDDRGRLLEMPAQRQTRYSLSEITMFLRSRYDDADCKDAVKYLPKIRHPTHSVTRNDCLRFLRIDPKTGDVRADSPDPMPDDSEGARFIWSE